MINRRNLLIGLVCVGAAGTAEALRPRQSLVLMPTGGKLSQLVPTAFPGWVQGGDGDIVIPRTEGTLAAKLYSDQLARTYHATVRGDVSEVMILGAYGGVQSDALQLHRPETCYPAIGFTIAARRETTIPLRSGQAVPAVSLTAVAGTRYEDIVYWTRLGEALPRTAGEQRVDRLRAAMSGVVGDGLLFRASAVRTAGDPPRYAELKRFLGAMIEAAQPGARRALVGSSLARA